MLRLSSLPHRTPSLMNVAVCSVSYSLLHVAIRREDRFCRGQLNSWDEITSHRNQNDELPWTFSPRYTDLLSMLQLCAIHAEKEEENKQTKTPLWVMYENSFSGNHCQERELETVSGQMGRFGCQVRDTGCHELSVMSPCRLLVAHSPRSSIERSGRIRWARHPLLSRQV